MTYFRYEKNILILSLRMRHKSVAALIIFEIQMSSRDILKFCKNGKNENWPKPDGSSSYND